MYFIQFQLYIGQLITHYLANPINICVISFNISIQLSLYNQRILYVECALNARWMYVECTLYIVRRTVIVYSINPINVYYYCHDHTVSTLYVVQCTYNIHRALPTQMDNVHYTMYSSTYSLLYYTIFYISLYNQWTKHLISTSIILIPILYTHFT